MAQLGGMPLIRHVAERLTNTSIDEIIVVAGDEADEVGRAIHGLRVHLAVNPTPDAGLSESLRVGLFAAAADAEAIVVALGDQPLIDSLVIELMIAAWRAEKGKIIVPIHGTVRGHPVLFDGSLRAELMLLEGDEGARRLLESYSSYVYQLSVDGPLPRDVDTPQDLADIERSLKAPPS